MCPKRSLQIAAYLMAASTTIMLTGGFIGFVDHDAWSLQSQIIAHIGIMLGAGFLKLGYVMHLNASRHLGINEFSFRAKAVTVPACCAAL